MSLLAQLFHDIMLKWYIIVGIYKRFTYIYLGQKVQPIYRSPTCWNMIYYPWKPYINELCGVVDRDNSFFCSFNMWDYEWVYYKRWQARYIIEKKTFVQYFGRLVWQIYTKAKSRFINWMQEICG